MGSRVRRDVRSKPIAKRSTMTPKTDGNASRRAVFPMHSNY